MDFETVDIEDDAPAPRAFKMRKYQAETISAVFETWKDWSRQLVVMAGGCGKTVVFSAITKRIIESNLTNKVLILAHTDELLEQAIDKLYRSTGLLAEKEKASDYASPEARVVVASIQTLARPGRLTGFADNHFSHVIVDECHRSLSPSYLRVLNYFHFGAESLVEGWAAPEPGFSYHHKAKVLGVTATASRGDKRSLGEFYQHVSQDYGLLEAVRDGYLVRPIVENIPLQIDLRGIKMSRSGGQGADLDLGEVSARIAPILREIAKQLAPRAAKLKTVIFTPSVETAKMLSEALQHEGMSASFVSGACNDREAKIEAFRSAGPGTVLCNALLVVEGFDVPDITGVCILRPTRIWSFYVQATVRGTRTLPGLIDHLETAEERLAAIAGSAKPHFTVFDFLWLSDKIDLVQPVDLVCTKPEVRKLLAESGATDLVAGEAIAERDFLKSLAAAAKKHARKAARTIDPLAWAVSLGDAKMATWEPETKWDEEPATAGQLEFLAKQGMDVTNVKYKGLASYIIGTYLKRMKLHLATPRQLTLMKQLGLPEDKAATMTNKEAGAFLDARLGKRKN